MFIWSLSAGRFIISLFLPRNPWHRSMFSLTSLHMLDFSHILLILSSQLKWAYTLLIQVIPNSDFWVTVPHRIQVLFSVSIYLRITFNRFTLSLHVAELLWFTIPEIQGFKSWPTSLLFAGQLAVTEHKSSKLLQWSLKKQKNLVHLLTESNDQMSFFVCFDLLTVQIVKFSS